MRKFTNIFLLLQEQSQRKRKKEHFLKAPKMGKIIFEARGWNPILIDHSSSVVNPE